MLVPCACICIGISPSANFFVQSVEVVTLQDWDSIVRPLEKGKHFEQPDFAVDPRDVVDLDVQRSEGIIGISKTRSRDVSDTKESDEEE